MKQIIFVLALLCPVLTISQDDIYYKLCTNCPSGENTSNINTTYSYEVRRPFISKDVTSDFGARFPGKKYDWHKGVDYRPSGCSGMDGCRGTTIVNIQGGNIDRIYALHGMKMIAIEGDGGHHYGYGHIFNSRFIGQNSTHQYINEGKFFIKHLEEYPVDKIYAIVDLENDIAYGPTEGTVNINVGNNQRILDVETTVDALQDLAPMGGSTFSFYNGTGSENDALSVHLHLYQFRDITASNLVRETHETNCMNPLHSLNHQNPSISVKWQLKGEHWWNSPVISPDGTQPNNFRIRALMQNVLNLSNQSVGETNKANKYSNVVNNINKVELILKKTGEVNGVNFVSKKNQSYINLGGNSVNLMYPSSLALNANYGKWNKQGINGFAYDDYNGYPYDEYFFDAFYTRINNLSNRDITDIPKNVRYTDGNYSLQGKVHNISNLVFNSTIQNFRIDNFLPFITRFQFKVGSWTSSTVFYEIDRKQNEGDKAKNDDGYVSNEEHYYKINSSPLSKYFIEINTSEPMQELRYKVRKNNENYTFNSFLMTSMDNTKMIWRAELPSLFFPNAQDELEFEITGKDLNDNNLMNIADMTKLIADFNLPGYQIKISTRKTNQRTSLAWNNYPSKIGLDRFKVKMSGCQRSANQEICDAIKLMEASKQRNSCTTVGLELNNYISNIEVTWTDENDNVISNNPNITVLTPGRYCYKILGEFGDDCCSKEGCIFVDESDFEDEEIIITPTIYPGCGDVGNQRGYVSLVVESFLPNITYSWSHNSGWNFPWAFMTPGNYSVTVSSSNECKRTLHFTVENTENVVQIYEDVIPSDCDQDNGEIHLTATLNGEENIFLNLNWSNGSVNSSLYELSPGEYCVTVTHSYAQDCKVIKCFTIQEKNISIEPIVTPNTNCNESTPNGRIELSVPNGTEPYTASWGDNASGMIRENLRVGPYIVTVTDANGCTASNIMYVPGTQNLNFTGEVSQDCSTQLFTIRLQNFPNPYIYLVTVFKLVDGIKTLQSYHLVGNGYEIENLDPGKYILETSEFPCKFGSIELDLPEPFEIINIESTPKSHIMQMVIKDEQM